jgi:hypothetical protein
MDDDSEFEQFAEAAKLYAEYAAVVEQVRQAFLADVNRFLDALRERVRSLVSIPIQEVRDDKKAGRRWWLCENEDSPYPDHLYIWISSDATKLVRPGVLEVSVWFYDKFKPFRHQIEAIKGTLKLPPSCKVNKGKPGSPFAVSISCGELDPLGIAAGPIAETLTGLYEVEQKIPVPKPQ